MPIEPERQPSLVRRYVCAIVVIAASLAMSVGIFYWHYTAEMAAGNVPNEYRNYEGSLKNGELWYRVIRYSGNPLSPKATALIRRLNLDTGESHDREFESDDGSGDPVWIGDTLYMYSETSVRQVYGTSQLTLGPNPFRRIVCAPFLYDGHVTVACDTRNNQHIRLASWIDGHWNIGREILLPSENQAWFDDPERGHTVQIPRTSDNDGSWPGSRQIAFGQVQVVEYHQEFCLLFGGETAPWSARRTGFEFVDVERIEPSALAPENAPHEPTGWTPILEPQKLQSWGQVSCDHEGVLFATAHVAPMQLVRQMPDGKTIELTGDSLNSIPRGSLFDFYQRPPWIAANPAENQSYVVQSDHRWGTAIVRRISGNTVQAPHLIVPGFQTEYVSRWIRICLRLLSLWIMPIAVVIAAADWIIRHSTSPNFVDRNQTRTLAPLWRRTAARTIDMIVVLVLSWLLFRLYYQAYEFVWRPGSSKDIADSLVDLESVIRFGPQSEILNVLRLSQLNWIILPIDFRHESYGTLLGSFLPPYVVNLALEGRFGFTPGKWLMGIKTLRTTLQPCGFTRALLRDFLLCVDVPLGLTPIPAVISLMLSDYRQRLGDRVADTVVVRRR